LVIALTPYASIQNPGEVNPYFASALHIVDGTVNAVPPAVLNPDDRSAAAGIAASPKISILSGGIARPSAALGAPAGWFDTDHLLFTSGPCCQPLISAAVLDVNCGAVAPIASGMAGSADPYAPFFVPIPNSMN
jgi:hypothetical protein